MSIALAFLFLIMLAISMMSFFSMWLVFQVLSIQQLYRISTMYWDDKYGTHSLSPDVSPHHLWIPLLQNECLYFYFVLLQNCQLSCAFLFLLLITNLIWSWYPMHVLQSSHKCIFMWLNHFPIAHSTTNKGKNNLDDCMPSILNEGV